MTVSYLCGELCGTHQLRNGFACVSDVSVTVTRRVCYGVTFCRTICSGNLWFLVCVFAGVILSFLKQRLETNSLAVAWLEFQRGRLASVIWGCVCMRCVRMQLQLTQTVLLCACCACRSGMWVALCGMNLLRFARSAWSDVCCDVCHHHSFGFYCELVLCVRLRAVPCGVSVWWRVVCFAGKLCVKLGEN